AALMSRSSVSCTDIPINMRAGRAGVQGCKHGSPLSRCEPPFATNVFLFCKTAHGVTRLTGHELSPGNRAPRLSWDRMATLGKRNILSVVRASAPGLYLDGGELGEILLPGRYIPANLKPKDKLEVFVYRDSEDRLVATTEISHAAVGEFACLKVVSINDRVGAFLDWGLAKDLLLPFREQERWV